MKKSERRKEVYQERANERTSQSQDEEGDKNGRKKREKDEVKRKKEIWRRKVGNIDQSVVKIRQMKVKRKR